MDGVGVRAHLALSVRDGVFACCARWPTRCAGYVACECARVCASVCVCVNKPTQNTQSIAGPSSRHATTTCNRTKREIFFLFRPIRVVQPSVPLSEEKTPDMIHDLQRESGREGCEGREGCWLLSGVVIGTQEATQVAAGKPRRGLVCLPTFLFMSADMCRPYLPGWPAGGRRRPRAGRELNRS